MEIKNIYELKTVIDSLGTEVVHDGYGLYLSAKAVPDEELAAAGIKREDIEDVELYFSFSYGDVSKVKELLESTVVKEDRLVIVAEKRGDGFSDAGMDMIKMVATSLVKQNLIDAVGEDGECICAIGADEFAAILHELTEANPDSDETSNSL